MNIKLVNLTTTINQLTEKTGSHLTLNVVPDGRGGILIKNIVTEEGATLSMDKLTPYQQCEIWDLIFDDDSYAKLGR